MIILNAGKKYVNGYEEGGKVGSSYLSNIDTYAVIAAHHEVVRVGKRCKRTVILNKSSVKRETD